MSVLEDVERLLPQLSPAEKAQVLQWIVQDMTHAVPGIERTPAILDGEARIMRTRIPIWVLVQARRLGATEAELLRSYPTLRAEDLTHAWAYARAYPDEIDQAIRENEAA
ncbi:MAG: DUF433 domain-containing protein [Chloroflexia bacterium]|nr:DUF433 domain-containing protein [Chloroflexia bacterium]